MRTYIHAYRPGTLASNNIMPKKNIAVVTDLIESEGAKSIIENNDIIIKIGII